MIISKGNSSFRVYNVGQGLFYTGDIILDKNKVFKFIYDCGGDKVNDTLDKYLGEDAEIDMLVISHFDSDHISGLPKLLNSVNRVKKIFIPYYNDLDSYLLLMAYVYGNGATFKKVDEIVLVDSNEEFEDNQNTQDFSELGVVNLFDNNNRYRVLDVGVGKIRKKAFSVEEKWIFKFYNASIKASKNTVTSHIDRLIESEKCKNLEELLSLNLSRVIVKLKEIYSKYCSSRYGNSKQNQSSLCLFHAPINKKEIVYKSIEMNSEKNEKKGIEIQEYWKVTGQACGTILTGDVSLKIKENPKNYNEFKEHYKNEIDNIGIFLLPHHGAKNNWNSRVLTDFYSASIFLNSAGRFSKYNHPSKDIIKELVLSGKIVLCSHEDQVIEYIFPEIYKC